MSIGETDLMLSDVPSERFQPMRSVYLSLSANSIDEAERIFALLSDGGEIFMPMQQHSSRIDSRCCPTDLEPPG
jgi:PhnB protein